MTDIENALRAAMHSAVDAEEASHAALISQVRRRHRRHIAVVAIATVLTVLAAGVPASIVARHLMAGPPPLEHQRTPPPSRMSGMPVRDINLQVLTTTARGAAWYSTATQRFTPIAGLPSIAGGYRFGRFLGGWGLWAANKGSPAAALNYFLANGSRRATLIGSGNSANGSSPDSVWLAGSTGARLVTWSGRPLGPAYQLPSGYGMWRGVGRYLLISSTTGTPVLWNPQTGHVVRRFRDFIDAGPEQVVWSQGCEQCRLQVLNLLTGRNLQTDIPAFPVGGVLNETLTDDGLLLAVQLPGGNIGVLRTANGQLTVLRGSAVSSAEWQNFSWLDGGHELIITAGPNGAPSPMQLAYWRPGDAQLRIAVVRNLAEITAFETGTVGT